MRNIFLCGIYFLVAMVEPAWADSCDLGGRSKYRHEETISLKPLPQGPAFYSRVGNYVLFFQPDTVISALEGEIKDESVAWTDERRLLKFLREQLPLTTSADLYSMAVDRKVAISDIDFLVKNLLFNGNASLRAMPRDVDVDYSGESSVREIVWEKPRTGASGTIYCSADNFELLAVTSNSIP